MVELNHDKLNSEILPEDEKKFYGVINAIEFSEYSRFIRIVVIGTSKQLEESAEQLKSELSNRNKDIIILNLPPDVTHFNDFIRTHLVKLSKKPDVVLILGLASVKASNPNILHSINIGSDQLLQEFTKVQFVIISTPDETAAIFKNAPDFNNRLINFVISDDETI